jgi:hypothetical protein
MEGRFQMNTPRLLPFNIEAIKAGSKCVTRDGREAKFVRDHALAPSFLFEITGGGRVWVWHNGCLKTPLCFDEDDLFILDETQTIPMHTEPRYEYVKPKDFKPSDEYYDGHGNWNVIGNNNGLPLRNWALPIRRIIPSPWVAYADRKPEEKDANSFGFVLVGSSLHDEAQISRFDSQYISTWSYWMPILPLPRPARDFQLDYVKKLEGMPLYMWQMLGEVEQGMLEKQWRKENP